jgi:hypothetical protein
MDKVIALKLTILVVVKKEEFWHIGVVKSDKIFICQSGQESRKLLWEHNFSIWLVWILDSVLVKNFTEDKNCPFVDISFFLIQQGYSALLTDVQILNNNLEIAVGGYFKDCLTML